MQGRQGGAGRVMGVQGRASLEGEGGRSGQFQSGCRAVTGDVKAVGGWAVTGGWKCGWGSGVGVWECESGPECWGGNPPPFQAMPWCREVIEVQVVGVWCGGAQPLPMGPLSARPPGVECKEAVQPSGPVGDEMSAGSWLRGWGEGRGAACTPCTSLTWRPKNCFAGGGMAWAPGEGEGGGVFQKWASVPGPLFCVRTDVATKGAGTQILARKIFFTKKFSPTYV